MLPLMTSAIRLYCRFAAEGADEVDDEDDELNEGHEGHTDVEPHQTTDTAEQRFDLERDHEKNESDNIFPHRYNFEKGAYYI